MATNRLNLQIGGPGPEEYERRKVMREVKGVNAEVDALIEQFVVEEQQREQYIEEQVTHPTVEEEVVEPRQKTRQELMAESISLYHTKTNQTLEEIPEASDRDRIKLLEDAFAQMKRAQPGTLVSGIGASLDSGGGAVWLWDLNDVNIGIPVSGTYPNIQDGATLQYDRDRQQWEPGPPVGTPDAIGAISQTFLDFDGTQTAQAIRAYGATDKVFEIEVGDTQQNTPIVARFESNPNKLVLPSGQLESTDVHTVTATIGTLNTGTIQGDRIGVLWKLSAGDGLAFDGQASGHIGGTPGETGGNAYSVGYGTLKVGTSVLRTTGSQIITGDKTYTGSTAEAKSLQTKESVDQLISDAVGSEFTFKGTTDVTGAAPVAVAGDFYINTVAGVADDSWVGIAGSTISADQLVIYSGSESRWFAGTVEDNSTFLAKTGGTMIGDITMDDESVINFSNSQTFPPSLTADYLQKSGGTMSGTLVTDEVEVPLGKTLTIKRGNNNTSSSGLDIKGYQPGQFTVETDIFSVSYGNGTSTGDSINYKGRVDGSQNLQTKSSVQALINENPVTGFVEKAGDTMTGELQIDISSANPSNIALEIEEDGSTNFRVLRTGFVSSKVITCTGMNVNGPSSHDGASTYSNQLIIDGVNTNGSDNVFAQDGTITFNGVCEDGFISKSGGNNNFLRFGAGTSSSGKVIATMGVLENGNMTFTSSLGSSDFIGTSTVWNKRVAESYNVVNGTASTYNEDGDLLTATVGGDITFSQPVSAAEPSLDGHLATKAYVDGGSHSGDSVRDGHFKLTKNRSNTVGDGPIILAPANSSNEWALRVDSADNLNFDSKVGTYSELIWFQPDGGAHFSGDVEITKKLTLERTRTGSNGNSFIIKGRIGGVEGQTLFKDYQRMSNAGGGAPPDDYIEYFGATPTDNSIVNKKYIDDNYIKVSGSPRVHLTGGTAAARGERVIDVQSGQAGRLAFNQNTRMSWGDGKIWIGTSNQANVGDTPKTITLDLQENPISNVGAFTLKHTSNTGKKFIIRGEGTNGADSEDFFYSYQNLPGTLDAINYTGKMDSDNNIVNKKYVDDNSSKTTVGTSNNPSLATGEMYWNTNLQVLYVGN